MASLVADYGTSSGSDTDSEESASKTGTQPAPSSAVVNFLESAAVEDDSDSNGPTPNNQAAHGTTDTPSSPDTGPLLPIPLAASPKLPSPALGGGLRPETSVFVTAFHRAEEAKSSILEQHVKMTDSDLPAEVGGKKICWNFRKGKCRFGYKCRFSHGAEIRGHTRQGTANGEVAEPDAPSSSCQPQPKHTAHRQLHGQVPRTQGHTGHGHPQIHAVQGHLGQQLSGQGHVAYMPQGYHQPWPQGEGEAVPDEDDYLSNAKRKKRVGVTDTMVPPKRAMRDLDRFRAEERPWTVQQ